MKKRETILDDLQLLMLDKGNLACKDIETVCNVLLDDTVAIEARAQFLQTLHEKGETPEEIALFVNELLRHALPLPFSGEGCLDVCGTGGDKAGLFNVSTAVMFVAAACGARVVKHGNRGLTSKAGGADVLEALGVQIDLPSEKAAEVLDKAGCCFLFAPHYHPAFKTIAPVREYLASRGIPTIFNMLGPLLNPARPSFQLAGVFNPAFLSAYAEVFRRLGRRHAWAIHGEGPCGMRLDEASPIGITHVTALTGGEIREFLIHPGEFDIGPLRIEDFQGGDALFNARIILDVLAGKLRNGARTIVQLNAAAALVVAQISEDLSSAWTRAGLALDDGSAQDVLHRLRSYTSF